jgi:hypothetical protein
MELSKKHKTDTIGNWKRSGLIYHDFDELYEVYIKTMNCQHCGKEFPNKFDRCLDHAHETGMFRKIVCRQCNTKDKYINHPEGYDNRCSNYYQKHKKEIYNRRTQKTKCECGVELTKGRITTHRKTMKHMDWWINSLD